jgi:peroxiredoxin
MSEESDSEVQLGSPAPDFRLLASNNQQIGLEDFRGKANMVLFFVREYG